MKNRVISLLLCLLLLCLTACGQPEQSLIENEDSAPSTETESSNSELPLPLQDFLKQAGLVDPDLFSVSSAVSFAQGMTGKAYLFLADDTNVEDTFNSFAFLAVVYDQTVLLNSLDSYALGGTVCADGDLDGDGYSEILVHLAQGAAGGAGNYSTRVFNLQSGQLIELYNFDDFDTGYSIELLKDKNYRISNRFTGYSATFTREDQDDAYFDHWYDEHGGVQDLPLMVDSFFECRLTDQDAQCQLIIKQYTGLVDHADYLGDAVTVLTYDSEAKTFKVIRTSFEPQ